MLWNTQKNSGKHDDRTHNLLAHVNRTKLGEYLPYCIEGAFEIELDDGLVAVKQGRIIKLDFSPQRGHEQAGYRQAIVTSKKI
jgi:hypothetical protein